MQRGTFYGVLLWQCIVWNNKCPSYQSECTYSICGTYHRKSREKKNHSEMITWMTFQKITLWVQVKIIFPWIHHNVYTKCSQMFEVHVLSNRKRISFEHFKWKRVKQYIVNGIALWKCTFPSGFKLEQRKMVHLLPGTWWVFADDNCRIFGIALHGSNLRIIVIIII